MLLAIDIGNSHVVGGVFEKQQLRGSWRVATDKTKTADEFGILFSTLLESYQISHQELSGCIMSSVVPPITPIFKKMVETFFHQTPHIVSVNDPFGLILHYEKPEEIGTDRLTNAAAAYDQFHRGLIIVDFGTATTFCTVTSKGEYLGGAIAPGLKSAADSLHSNTAQLPTVDLVQPKSVIGNNTATSIQSGLVYGYTGLVDELVHRIEEEIGQKSLVIATGGLASVIAPISRKIQEVRPNLTLEGLELLHRRRCSQIK